MQLVKCFHDCVTSQRIFIEGRVIDKCLGVSRSPSRDLLTPRVCCVGLDKVVHDIVAPYKLEFPVLERFVRDPLI